MRGERRRGYPYSSSIRGSSPHARGTLALRQWKKASCRFIPACAGNARAEKMPCRDDTVHPRMRGERDYILSFDPYLAGSSPHARGTLLGERSDVAALMKAADLLVAPSLREGMSNVILEAMALGLPVLATRVGGTPEVIEDGRHGVLVDPTDTQALAGAMLQLIDDPVRRQAIGQAGRQKVLEQYSPPAMVSAMLKEMPSIHLTMLLTGKKLNISKLQDNYLQVKQTTLHLIRLKLMLFVCV